MRWVAGLILIGLIIVAGAYLIGGHEANISAFIRPLNPRLSGASHASLCMSPPSALTARLFANESGIFAEVPICFQGSDGLLDEAYVRYIAFTYNKYFPIGYLDESKYFDHMEIDRVIYYEEKKIAVNKMMKAGVYVFNISDLFPNYIDSVTLWNGYVIKDEKMAPLESVGTLVFENRSICRVEELIFSLWVYRYGSKDVEPPFKSEAMQRLCDIYMNQGAEALKAYLGELMNRTIEMLKTGAIPAPFRGVNIAEMFDKDLASLLVYARLRIKDIYATLIPKTSGVRYIAYNIRLVSATPLNVSEYVIASRSENDSLVLSSAVSVPPTGEGRVVVIYSVNPFSKLRALSIRFTVQNPIFQG